MPGHFGATGRLLPVSPTSTHLIRTPCGGGFNNCLARPYHSSGVDILRSKNPRGCAWRLTVIDSRVKSFLDGQHDRLNSGFPQITAGLSNPDAPSHCLWRKGLADDGDPQRIQKMPRSQNQISPAHHKDQFSMAGFPVKAGGVAGIISTACAAV